MSDPTVDVAKTRRSAEQEVTLHTGLRARLYPVSFSLIEEVRSRIPDPPIPTVWDEERQRELENPDHPAYKRNLDRAEEKRGAATMDAMIMFGVEILDPLPEKDSWIKKLRQLEKIGRIDLSNYDLKDPLDLEFLYKRYIGVTPDIIEKVSLLSQTSAADIERVEASFRGNQARDSDS